jgi:FtsP/CotA-like multicopper oxidase with cupredoxin domain
VEEWTLVNRSMMDHPFHIHVNPFQVVAVNGRALATPEWRDVVNLPRMMGSVTIRSRFLDFSGLTALHCHITPHEDLGMMAIVRLA